jgi:hypothetical protein
MNRVRRCGGLSGAAGLAAAALLHVYWLAGGRRGLADVIPRRDGQPAFRPGPVATAGVAVALASGAALYRGAALGRRPRSLYRTGARGAAIVLAARALGDRRQVGFLKRERNTAFARLDTKVLSPVCAALAVTGFVAAS